MFDNLRKKISKAAFYFCALCFAAIFFALVTLTPASNILTTVLIGDFKNTFDDPAKGGVPDVPKILLNLIFPGINLDNRNISESHLLKGGGSGEAADGGLHSPEPEKRYDPYANLQITSDDSILSIYDLYELYGTASGAKITEATPPRLDNSQIPPDYFRITPGNYSRQQTRTPQLHLLNGTSLNIDLYDFLAKKYPIAPFDPQKTQEPVVLILNTHTTESFVDDGTEYYSPPFTAERTADLNRNVALIATELRKTLEDHNIPVIQSTRVHDAVSFRDSYIRSLETKNEYLEKYPSIKYIIDLHRDSIIAPDGEKFKPTININGRDAAQIMMVIGTDDGGANHPHWRDNLAFAVHLQQKINDKYPMLARPVYLRNARFNQHVTTGTIILEVGSCGSTFSEALYAADLFGQCLAELILENNQIY